MYWGFQRNPGANPHRAKVVARFLLSFFRLWIIRLSHPFRPLILISLVGSMGDIVAAEPISREARRRYPNGFIVWIVTPAFADLPRRFEAVDKVFEVLCLSEWMLLLGVRPPGIVWDLHVSDAMCAQCRAPLSKSGPVAAITLQTYYDLGNLLTVQCRCADIAVIDDAPRLDPGPDASRKVDELGLPPRYIVVHCTASHASRNWPDSAWDSATGVIHEDLGWPIAEIGLTPVTAGAKDGRYIDLCNRLSILETAEVIRRAVLFIGIDSGPTHLANAVGTPGVVMIGKYVHWDNYMPYSGPYADGTGADLLRVAGPIALVPAETVVRATERRIGRAINEALV
jgi:heptosyltransferase-3